MMQMVRSDMDTVVHHFHFDLAVVALSSALAFASAEMAVALVTLLQLVDQQLPCLDSLVMLGNCHESECYRP